MSDSDCDLNNYDFGFQNTNTTISAKGPNTNLNYREPSKISSFTPYHFQHRNYASSVGDGSVYRGASAMSIHRADNTQPRNFQHQYLSMCSQRSIRQRSGSSMSLRSLDTNASVGATEIVFALENMKFNTHDLQLIKHAYQKLMKRSIRKRVEKRRNLRKFLNVNRRRSGYDSGEQGSNSSISSEDDCRSIKTSMFRENLSGRHLQDSVCLKENVLQNCTKNIKSNTCNNMLSTRPVNMTSTFLNSDSVITKQNNTTQKNRFKSVYLLPSQRFNQSIASNTIMENCNEQNKHAENKTNGKQLNGFSIDGESEKIFTTVVNEHTQKKDNRDESVRKRGLCANDLNLPNNKKIKSSKQNPEVSKNNKSDDKSSSNFDFVKPMIPTKKLRPKIQEKIVAKSSQPLSDIVENEPNKHQDAIDILTESTTQDKFTHHDQHEDKAENSEVSMRPSFIKRKLFTQNLDVTQRPNPSIENTNSPQSADGGIYKEKNKARKLVATRSCLSRDIQDDNNLLDLIHKIVPPDSINVTSQTNMYQSTKTVINNKTNKEKNDKWDITSIISTCNDDNISDTFTDEETFKSDNNENLNIDVNKVQKDAKDKRVAVLSQECRIFVEKLTDKTSSKQHVTNNETKVASNDGTKNKSQVGLVKSFWDTDFESDVDYEQPHRNNYNVTLHNTKRETKNPPKMLPTPNNIAATSSLINSTIENKKKFNFSNLNIRSHRICKAKICCNENLNLTTAEVHSQNNTRNDLLSSVTQTESKLKSTANNTEKENVKTISNQKKSFKKSAQKKPEQTVLDVDSEKTTLNKPKNDSIKGKASSKSNGKSRLEKNVTSDKNSKKNKSAEKTIVNNELKKSYDVESTSECIVSDLSETTHGNVTRNERPIRACRMQNKSNSSRILRSRSINTSLSFDDITINIKTRPKAANNNNITQRITRTSNVCFTLNKTATPKKSFVCNRRTRKK